jgi:hypothetical protein
MEGGATDPRTESSLLSNGLGGSLLLGRVVCGLHGSIKNFDLKSLVIELKF